MGETLNIGGLKTTSCEQTRLEPSMLMFRRYNHVHYSLACKYAKAATMNAFQEKLFENVHYLHI